MKRSYQLLIERLQIVCHLSRKSNSVVTLRASQSGKSASSTELQTRMEQLLKQLSELEEEKRKATSEKDDLQQQLLKQKDRMVETEREVGYTYSIS
jgi:chromosome segregation ATPase